MKCQNIKRHSCNRKENELINIKMLSSGTTDKAEVWLGEEEKTKWEEDGFIEYNTGRTRRRSRWGRVELRIPGEEVQLKNSKRTKNFRNFLGVPGVELIQPAD